MKPSVEMGARLFWEELNEQKHSSACFVKKNIEAEMTKRLTIVFLATTTLGFVNLKNTWRASLVMEWEFHGISIPKAQLLWTSLNTFC